MNKKIKLLLLGGVAVLFLAIVLIVLLQTKPTITDETESATSAVATVKLIEKNAADLKSINIENSTGTFSILPKTVTVKATEEGAEDTKETQYSLDTLKGYPQSASSVKVLVNALTALNASEKVFEEVDDKKKYGLDQPQATTKLDFDGEVITLYLGDLNEGTKIYYAMLEGDNALYAVTEDIGSKILASQLAYLDTSLLPTYDPATPPAVQIKKLAINRPDLKEPVVLQAYSGGGDAALRAYMSAYELTSPIKSEVNYHVDDDYLPNYFGMSAESAVALYKEADAKKYGFDKPTMTVQTTYVDTEETAYDELLVIGKQNEETSNYYVLMGEDNVVYEVTADQIYLLDVTADDLITSLPLLPGITTVSSVDVQLDGKSYSFEITSTPQESKTSEEEGKEPTLEVTGVQLDGKEVDVDNFKQYYQLLISTSVDQVNTDKASGDPILSIAYNYEAGGKDQLDCYLVGNDRRTQVVINNTPLYEGRAGYIEKLRTETQKLLDGKDVEIDW